MSPSSKSSLPRRAKVASPEHSKSSRSAWTRLQRPSSRRMARWWPPSTSPVQPTGCRPAVGQTWSGSRARPRLSFPAASATVAAPPDEAPILNRPLTQNHPLGCLGLFAMSLGQEHHGRRHRSPPRLPQGVGQPSFGESGMNWGSRIRGLAVGVVSLLLVAACGSSGTGTASCGASAKSAADCGGMSALVTAAKAEKELNVIALPPDWANYGAIITGFTAKYGIKINSANPNGSSQDEVDAVNQLGTTSPPPDVLDLRIQVPLTNTGLFAPHQVTTGNYILAGQKDAGGLWYQDYGGYMSIGYDSAKVPTINPFSDLLGSAFNGRVTLHGDPTKANPAVNGVLMASTPNRRA